MCDALNRQRFGPCSHSARALHTGGWLMVGFSESGLTQTGSSFPPRFTPSFPVGKWWDATFEVGLRDRGQKGEGGRVYGADPRQPIPSPSPASPGIHQSHPPEAILTYPMSWSSPYPYQREPSHAHTTQNHHFPSCLKCPPSHPTVSTKYVYQVSSQKY
jgi:hypothetical protein